MSVELQRALEHNAFNKLPTTIVQMVHSLSTFITTNKNDVQHSKELCNKQLPGITFTVRYWKIPPSLYMVSEVY